MSPQTRDLNIERCECHQVDRTGTIQQLKAQSQCPPENRSIHTARSVQQALKEQPASHEIGGGRRPALIALLDCSLGMIALLRRGLDESYEIELEPDQPSNHRQRTLALPAVREAAAGER